MLRDILQYRFLTNALIAVFLSAAATSQISVFVTLKKLSFLGEAFSHIAFAGIAIALLLGTEMTATTLLFVVFIAVLISIVSKYYNYQETNIITIFLSLSMAIGIILLNLNRDYTPDVASYLFGNVLLVTEKDIFYLFILSLVNLAFIILFFKEMFYLTYNYTIASVFRIPVVLTYYLFTILLAANIVISVKIVGIIMITAQLILPGISALNLTMNVTKAIIISCLIAVIGAVTGFVVSYYLNLPSGACIVILLFILFIVTLLFRQMKNRYSHYRHTG